MTAGLGWRRLLAYGGPGFALAMPTIPVFVFLPSFYAEDLGLGLAAVGTAMLAARAVDVVSDPLAGWLCDSHP
ncbi:MAG: MFS transporter, partial [Caenispirillum sp.]|nr:MFS transporter [Caenispirillum sp.]